MTLIEIADLATSENFRNWHRKRISDALWIPHSIVTCIFIIIVGIDEMSSNYIHIDNLNQGMLQDASTHEDAIETFEQVKDNINSGILQHSLGSFASPPLSCTLMSNKSTINFVDDIHKHQKNKRVRPSNTSSPISNDWLTRAGSGLPTFPTLADSSRMCKDPITCGMKCPKIGKRHRCSHQVLFRYLHVVDKKTVRDFVGHTHDLFFREG